MHGQTVNVNFIREDMPTYAGPLDAELDEAGATAAKLNLSTREKNCPTHCLYSGLAGMARSVLVRWAT